MVIENKNGLTKHSFWSNEKKDLDEMLLEFIQKIRFCKNITLYHYGSYENKLFKLLLDRFPNNKTVKRTIDNSINLLSTIYPSIYFPTYSNNLKDIAGYLGFRWTEEDLNGLQSIVLRKKWEFSKSTSLKTSILRYNIEDCLALREVTNFLMATSSGSPNKIFPRIEVSSDFHKEIRARYGGRYFNNPDFKVKNFDYINKCAYFDYQRAKIYLKTDDKIKKSNIRADKQKRKFHKTPNNQVNIRKSLKCPNCKSNNVRVSSKTISKIVVDIKFFNGGIKRWITKYNANYHQCRDCLKNYFPSRYKNIGIKYGHNLISWVVFQNLVNGLSFGKIQKNLADYFQISIGSVGGESSYRFKTIAAEYYKREYNSMSLRIKSWNIIHIDETRVRIQGLSGYIWVLTNMTEVFFVYTETRKIETVVNLIKGFKGVLISDFYKGYESIKCKQQKCLVHLIRDINDALFKYQQNEELKLLAVSFSDLLKKIVDTTRKYGLKKRHLQKHKKDVRKFYKFLDHCTFDSNKAKKFVLRFEKFKNQLFTFLDYDGVPWNNNNAEHAFKHFATYRRSINGVFTENGIKRYLILLSIYETCKYRNVDFLKFLLSKEKYIDVYERKYTAFGNLRKGNRPNQGTY